MEKKMNGSSLSRRTFMQSLAAASAGSALLGRAAFAAATDDPRVEQILAKYISIDMHNHAQVKLDHPPQPSDSIPDLAGAIRQSGFTAISAAFALDFAKLEQPGDAYGHFMNGLAWLDEELKQGDMHRALNSQDLQAAHARRQPTIVQSCEGAQFLEGHLDRVEEVYKRGLRQLQLLHEKDDVVKPLGDVYTRPAHLGGLTSFGAEIIRECNRLGILVDLAHASPETIQGALKIATKPILVSHTSMDKRPGNKPIPHGMAPHLISAEHARVVADAGGVVGVWIHVADTVEECVEGIRMMVDAIGVDHVGIGTDSDITGHEDQPNTNEIWPNHNRGLFRELAAEMLQQGFKPEEIGKIGGGNYCRLFDAATSVHS
jgi:membrane dipeptidase